MEPGGADHRLVLAPDDRERHRDPLGPRRESIFDVAAHAGLVLGHQDPLIERRILAGRLQQPRHVVQAERLQPHMFSVKC